MTAYLTLPLIQAILAFCLLLLVGWKGPRNRDLRQVFLVFLGSMSIWGLLIFAMRASPDTSQALPWERRLMPLSILMAVAFYHFAAGYTGRRVTLRVITLLYALPIAVFPISISTDLLVPRMQLKSYGYAPVLGPLMLLVILVSVALVIAAIVLLVRYARRTADFEARQRAWYMVAGSTLSLIGVSFDLLPVMGLPSYPGSIIGNIAFCILTTVAILRYRLLDIDFMLRRGVVYSLATASFIFTIMGAWLLFRTLTDSLPRWVDVAMMATLSVVAAPAWLKLQRRINYFMYRERFECTKALEALSRETPRLTDTTMGERVVALLSRALRVSEVNLLLPASNGCFKACFTTSAAGVPAVEIPAHSSLMGFLMRTGLPLSMHDILVMPQSTHYDRQVFHQLGAELCVPVRAEKQLAGLITVSKKPSGDPYDHEEQALLQGFANQLASRLENMRLYSNALSMQHSLELLSRRLVEIQEEERRSIARDLHDEISQSLAVVKMSLDGAIARPSRAASALTQARTMVTEVIGQVREMCLNLRPSILDDLGLLPALEWYLSRYTDRTGIRVDFKYDSRDVKLPGQVRTTAYRTIQEGLSNIARHARTKEAELRVYEETDGLRIILQDHGAGFDPARVNSNSTGITGMKERVSLLKGNMRVESSPGRGTRLSLHLPLKERTFSNGYSSAG